MDDLEALFESVDGFKEDLIDFGVAGLGAVGANIAWDYVEANLVSRLPVVGTSLYGRAAVAVVAGVAAGAALARYNRNVATGVAVGLAARGLGTILRALMPTGLPPKESTEGLAAGGLPPGESTAGLAAGIPMVEEVNGFGAATTTVEMPDAVHGLAATFQ